MPLPPALASRLAKRGLLQEKHRTGAGTNPNPTGYVEEIIAESYDEPETPESVEAAAKLKRFHKVGHSGCPNKTNVYHTCSQFCVTRWGRGRLGPDPVYNLRRLRMLRKFPLPPKWQEIYDPGCARYYYWNLDTDDVCWISPRHPKALVSRPASELRTKIIDAGEDILPPTIGPSKDKPVSKQRYRPGRDDRDGRRIKKGKVEDLDPMDPSAYSDVPRGGWDAGLEKETERTGVDTTASGPLFQVRPYPSPGAILRANAVAKGKKSK